MATNSRTFKFIAYVLICAMVVLSFTGVIKRENICFPEKATLSPSLQIAQRNFNIAAQALYQEKNHIIQSLPGYTQENKIEQMLRDLIKSAQQLSPQPINVSVKLSEVPLPKYILFFLGRKILAGVIAEDDFYTMYLTPYLLRQSETEIRKGIAHELAHVIRQDKETELIRLTLIENISFLNVKFLLIAGFMAKNMVLLLSGLGMHCFWLACGLIIHFFLKPAEKETDLMAEKILSQPLTPRNIALPELSVPTEIISALQKQSIEPKKKNLLLETKKNIKARALNIFTKTALSLGGNFPGNYYKCELIQRSL